jgi:hypothetical protein
MLAGSRNYNAPKRKRTTRPSQKKTPTYMSASSEEANVQTTVGRKGKGKGRNTREQKKFNRLGKYFKSSDFDFMPMMANPPEVMVYHRALKMIYRILSQTRINFINEFELRFPSVNDIGNRYGERVTDDNVYDLLADYCAILMFFYNDCTSTWFQYCDSSVDKGSFYVDGDLHDGYLKRARRRLERTDYVNDFLTLVRESISHCITFETLRKYVSDVIYLDDFRYRETSVQHVIIQGAINSRGQTFKNVSVEVAEENNDGETFTDILEGGSEVDFSAEEENGNVNMEVMMSSSSDTSSFEA